MGDRGHDKRDRTSETLGLATWTGEQTRDHPPLTPVLLLIPSSTIQSKVLTDRWERWME